MFLHEAWTDDEDQLKEEKETFWTDIVNDTYFF